MSDALFFIAILDRALHRSDPKSSLAHALAEIKHLGQQPRYREGLANFHRFMRQVRIRRDVIENDRIHQAILEIGGDTFRGSKKDKQRLLDLIHSQPQWQDDYEKLCEQLAEITPQDRSVTILLFHEENVVGQRTFPDGLGRQSLSGIRTGSYRLQLTTGQVIWEKALSKQDLLWQNAYPQAPLDMAAKSQKSDKAPTGQWTLLDGELIVRVYPGVESGWLEIELIEVMKK